MKLTPIQRTWQRRANKIGALQAVDHISSRFGAMRIQMLFASCDLLIVMPKVVGSHSQLS
jgi:hypothetical protein